jgi:outer membrane protein assembly factor BamB
MRKHKWVLIILLCLIIIQGYGTSLGLSSHTIASADDWSTFRHDTDHSGYATDSSSADSVKLLWTYPTGRMVQSSPAVVNGCVFVGSRDSVIYCLNASNGKLIWQFPIRTEVWSSPAVYYGCVYIGADDGWFYCFNVTTGMPIWISKAGGPVRSSPAIVDDRVYIGSWDNGVFCFNATDGNTIWNHPTTNHVDSSPAVSNGILYVATDNYYVYALNASTGNEIWNRHTGSTKSSPSINNGYVYIGSYDGYVCALNASTGAQIWKYQTQDSVTSSPAVAYGYVYIGSEDNNLYCLNATSGQKIWQSPTEYWITSSPAVADGNVYVGSEDNKIHCFNASNGAQKWSYATGNYVESSPAIVNGTLYFGSDDKLIYALYLYNSTAGSSPFQSTNSLAWTTVIIDVIALALLTAIIYAIVRFVSSNRSRQQNEELTLVSGQTHSWFSLHSDAVFILVIIAFSIIFWVNLGNGHLWAADEQTYSQWAFHMVKYGDYINPWAFGESSFWVAKPPLYMWLMSFAYQVFGVNNFSSRLWSPIFGALSLILVFYLGKKLYNSYVGFVSAVVLGTFTTFYAFATHAMTDIVFVFFATASLYFLFLSGKTEKTNRYLVLSGLFFGLALMTKQIEALIIPLIAITYLVVTRKSVRFLVTKQFARFWAIGSIVLAPWLIYMILSFGQGFWQSYFIYSVVTRTISPIEGNSGGYLFYISYLVNNENLLWVILLPFAAGLCAVNAAIKRSKEDTLVFVWMSIVILVFTFAQTKLYWYVLPAFPAFAIAIGNLLYQLSKKIAKYYPRLDLERRFKLQIQ